MRYKTVNLIVLTLSLTFVSYVHSSEDMTLKEIDSIFYSENSSYQYLVGKKGYILDIEDASQLNIIIPDGINEKVPCHNIHPSLEADSYGDSDTERGMCFNGHRSKCSNLYQNSASSIVPPRSHQLVPYTTVMDEVNKFVNEYDPSNLLKVVATNINFFDVRSFPGREHQDWQPIFQQACGLNLGQIRSESGEVLSGYDDVHLYNGSPDKKLGTTVFQKGAGFISMDEGTNQWYENDIAFSGVFIRYDFRDRNKDHRRIPSFVREKWSSRVGRTAIGYNGRTGKTRVVVVQPGPGKTGVSVDDVRHFFKNDDFSNVMLLDGGGSSQLASNFRPTNHGSNNYEPRTECIYQNVEVCTIKGNTINNKYVSHWDSSFKEPDPNKDGNQLVDRKIPSVLIFAESN